MTIGQGNKIESAEYIAIQSVIAPILGKGSSTSGYGQSVKSSSVGVVQNSKISQEQWSNLRDDIVACRQHQTGITILDKTYGEVGYIAGQSLKIPTKILSIKERDRADFLSVANDCVTNKLTVDAAQQSTGDLLNPTGSSTSNGIRSTSWNGTISHTVTVNFTPTLGQLASGFNELDVARFFFNTGGKIQFSASRWDNANGTGAGTAGTKNYSWNQLLANTGIISFGATSTTKSNTNGVLTVGGTLGFYPGIASGSVNVEFLQYTNALSSDLYAPNQYDIYSKVVSDGTSTCSLVFRIEFKDLATDSAHGVWGVDEDVTGYLSSFVKAVYCTSNANVNVNVPTATTTAL